MRPPQTSALHQEGTLSRILIRLGSFTTRLPMLIGLPAVLGGFLVVYVLFYIPPESSLAAGIVYPTAQPSPDSDAGSHLEQNSPTPTPTPAASPQPTRTPLPTQTTSPTPTIPSSANVIGIEGHPQAMPLSCEARSAVDWAAYFGFEIDEKEFFSGLPTSDNPEEGFVGDVYGSWGQIPPEDYGVHAKPIAQRLREYGLKAKHLRHMTLEELKAEIAAGRPVIVWVVGHVNRGTPQPFTSSAGETTTVAKFEHTVIVTGYTEHRVNIVDGARVFSIYQGEFTKSWYVLENQAVVWIE